MNILTFTQNYPPVPGGIAAYLYDFCNQLVKEGNRVDVLTQEYKHLEKYTQGKLCRVYRYPYLKCFSAIIPIIKSVILHIRNKYEVIFIGHISSTHALGILALKIFFKVPYVILSHGNELNYSTMLKVDKWIAGILLRNARIVFGNSNFTARQLRKTQDINKIDVLNPGVDIEKFNPDRDTALWRDKYKLEGRKVLVTAARLVAKKNIETVLRALPQIIKKVPNVMYLIAGDGEQRKYLEELTGDLNVSEYVRFVGYIRSDVLASLYCSSDVFIMPACELYANDLETFGISYIEASACGKPVIAGRGGGVEDAVVDDRTGLLVDPLNVDKVSEAAIRLLSDTGLAEELGRNGRMRVEKELSWEKVVGRFVDIIETLLKIKAKPEKLHIGIITGDYWSRSGVGTSVREWVCRLADNKYSVSVAAPDVKKEDNSEYINYIKIKNIPFIPQVFFILTNLILIHLKHRFDVVHTHDSIAFFASYIFSKFSGVPNIFTFHASIFSKGREVDYNWLDRAIYKITNRFAARYADRIICVSRDMMNCARVAGAEEDKLQLIYNPIDLTSFKYEEMKEKKNVCLYVGALRPSKGVEYLIKAVPKVLKIFPEVKFVLIGDGPSRRKIEKLISIHEINQSVEVKGYISRKNLEQYYKGADIFVMPSVNEPQGIVALEAMACGLPVVASNVGGIPEMVKDCHNGLLVEPGFADLLAEKIIMLLKNESLRQSCSNGALETARLFSWDRNVGRIYEIYDSVIQRTNVVKAGL